MIKPYVQESPLVEEKSYSRVIQDKDQVLMIEDLIPGEKYRWMKSSNGKKLRGNILTIEKIISEEVFEAVLDDKGPILRWKTDFFGLKERNDGSWETENYLVYYD